MTFLLLQTLLLLLSSYFLGAFVACLVKRMLLARGAAIPAAAGLSPLAVREAPKVVQAPVAPRAFDPVQPKIDVLPRPEPRPAPVQVDTSRFDRALAGSIAATDVPRKPIVEIRPAILKSPTGPAVKLTPAPQAPAKTVNAAPPTPVQVPAPVSTASAAAAAAAAAISAAKTATASTSVPTIQPKSAPAPAQLVPQQPSAAAAPAPEPKRPLAEPPQQAPPAAAVKPAQVQNAPHAVKGGDDFQRIRAIDDDSERRLKGIGVASFEEIARWTTADINRVNQALGLGGRIDREQWIEQAQILAKGGETYYSRNRASAGQKPAAAPQVVPSPAPQQSSASSSTAAATAAAAAAATIAAKASAAQPAFASATPAPAPKPVASASSPATPISTSSSPAPQRSVAEMATAAAAAFAAASASVTRGVRPIEPISPLSKADPNLSLPAKLQDAIKEQEQKAGSATPREAFVRSVKADSDARQDDLKRVRGIGVLIEKRLNSLGISSYDQIANWTNADIDRISQTLDFKGRIERENWVEQARILSSGGATEFSRRVDKGEVETSRE